MSNLLDRAKVKLNNSKDNFNRSSGEDANMDMAAFDLHQSLEFVLKYMIEFRVGSYKKGHNIRFILDEAKSVGFERPEFEELKGYADGITKWESDARYGSGILTNVVTMRNVTKQVESLIEYADTLKTENSNILLSAATASDVNSK